MKNIEKNENRKDSIYKVNIRAIHDCMLAVSKDETRYTLTGVSIKDINGRRHYAGTNGHILIHFDEKINGEHLNKEIILKPLVKVKIKKNDDDTFSYGTLHLIDESTALLKDSNTKIACEIIEETYPDYERVIPKKETPLIKDYMSFNSNYMKIIETILGRQPGTPKAVSSYSPGLWESKKALCNLQCVLMPIRV